MGWRSMASASCSSTTPSRGVSLQLFDASRNCIVLHAAEKPGLRVIYRPRRKRGGNGQQDFTHAQRPR
eukprot:7315844-Pyramimonas_sp.AAC.1